MSEYWHLKIIHALLLPPLQQFPLVLLLPSLLCSCTSSLFISGLLSLFHLLLRPLPSSLRTKPGSACPVMWLSCDCVSRLSANFNKEVYVDFVAVQIKFLSFLAYIIRIYQVQYDCNIVFILFFYCTLPSSSSLFIPPPFPSLLSPTCCIFFLLFFSLILISP